MAEARRSDAPALDPVSVPVSESSAVFFTEAWFGGENGQGEVSVSTAYGRPVVQVHARRGDRTRTFHLDVGAAVRALLVREFPDEEASHG